MDTRQIEEPRRVEVAAARRPANPTGAKLVDADCAGRPLTQTEVEAINDVGACDVRAYDHSTCKLGTKGCSSWHEPVTTIEQVFDKLAAAGVEIGVNCDPVSVLRKAGAL